jgi:hypothetical protein
MRAAALDDHDRQAADAHQLVVGIAYLYVPDVYAAADPYR